MDSSNKHVLAGKRIVISGAGIAGLIFARTLQQQWPAAHPRPEIIVFERSPEVQPKSRAGYSVGIRAESGLKALHQVGLLDAAVRSSTMKLDNDLQKSISIWKKDWTLLMQASYVNKLSDGMPNDTPPYVRLSRGMLRDILLKDSTATIHYENMIQSAKDLGNGMELQLGDGTITTCDLLVVADGASSTLRRSMLPDQKLDFAGVVCYIGQSAFPNGKPHPLEQRWGINISGEGVPFMTFPVNDERGVWSTSYRTDKPVQRVSPEQAEERFDEILDEAHRLTPAFGEPCRQFIDATERDSLTVFNAMHNYPIEHAKALPQSNVIFLGDANHPMSPFSGNGANMALMDGVVAAEKFIEHSTSLRDAIAAFDAESMPRSKKAIDNSFWTIRLLHARGLTYWLLMAFFLFVNAVRSLKKR